MRTPIKNVVESHVNLESAIIILLTVPSLLSTRLLLDYLSSFVTWLI